MELTNFVLELLTDGYKIVLGTEQGYTSVMSFSDDDESMHEVFAELKISTYYCALIFLEAPKITVIEEYIGGQPIHKVTDQATFLTVEKSKKATPLKKHYKTDIKKFLNNDEA